LDDDDVSLSTTHSEPEPNKKEEVSAGVISVQHMDVRKLPPTLQPALKAIGYNKPTIAVETTEGYYLTGSSGNGTRNIAVAVNLNNGTYKVEIGSWGGANPFEKRQVDMDETVRKIPLNFAIIKGTNQGSKTLFARILISPENMQKMLPAKGETSEELSREEKYALNIVGGIKSAYRRGLFSDKGLGEYGPNNPILKQMAAKGWVKISGVGVQLTVDGKNMREQNRINNL